MRESYPVQMEVAGPAAMFARPDSGATYVSYPAPTLSAVKGMFEAVARVRGAWVRPTRVGICAPIHFESFKTNYLGPLRKNAGKRGGWCFEMGRGGSGRRWGRSPWPSEASLALRG